MERDVSGNPVWTRVLGGENDDKGYGVAPLTNGSFVLTGGSLNATNSKYNSFVVKLDEEGTILCAKTLRTTIGNDIRSIAVAPDGGFFVSGTTGISGALARLSSECDLVWARVLRGLDEDNIYINDLVSTSDGGVVTVGIKAFTIPSEGFDGVVAKWDADGDPVWIKELKSPKENYLNAVAVSLQNIFAAGDYSDSLSLKILLMKLEENGALLWAMSIGGAEFSTDIPRNPDLLITSGGTLVVTGNIKSLDNSDEYSTLSSEWDLEGQLVGAKTLNGVGSSLQAALSTTPNGNIAMAGTNANFGGGLRTFLVQMTPSGDITDCSLPTISPIITNETNEVSFDNATGFSSQAWTALTVHNWTDFSIDDIDFVFSDLCLPSVNTGLITTGTGTTGLDTTGVGTTGSLTTGAATTGSVTTGNLTTGVDITGSTPLSSSSSEESETSSASSSRESGIFPFILGLSLGGAALVDAVGSRKRNG
jgi:hypothetical protein